MAKRAGRFLARAAAGLAIVIVLAVPAPVEAAPPAVPTAGYGFGDGAQMTWLGAEDVNRELDAVAKTSATWLRVLVPWTQIETARGQYDWAQLDVVMNGAFSRNLRVLGVIAYSPDWARPRAPPSAPRRTTHPTMPTSPPQW